MVKSTGLFEVDFRIIIACRENTVCVLRRGWLEGKIIFQTTANIVDMLIIPGDNFIVVATDDKHLHCYTKRVCFPSTIWSSKNTFISLGSPTLDSRNGEQNNLSLPGAFGTPQRQFGSCRTQRWIIALVSRKISCGLCFSP